MRCLVLNCLCWFVNLLAWLVWLVRSVCLFVWFVCLFLCLLLARVQGLRRRCLLDSKEHAGRAACEDSTLRRGSRKSARDPTKMATVSVSQNARNKRFTKKTLRGWAPVMRPAYEMPVSFCSCLEWVAHLPCLARLGRIFAPQYSNWLCCANVPTIFNSSDVELSSKGHHASQLQLSLAAMQSGRRTC